MSLILIAAIALFVGVCILAFGLIYFRRYISFNCPEDTAKFCSWSCLSAMLTPETKKKRNMKRNRIARSCYQILLRSEIKILWLRTLFIHFFQEFQSQASSYRTGSSEHSSRRPNIRRVQTSWWSREHSIRGDESRQRRQEVLQDLRPRTRHAKRIHAYFREATTRTHATHSKICPGFVNCALLGESVEAQDQWPQLVSFAVRKCADHACLEVLKEYLAKTLLPSFTRMPDKS